MKGIFETLVQDPSRYSESERRNMKGMLETNTNAHKYKLTYLDPNEFGSILDIFPEIELSYETMIHKKVDTEKYDIAMAIPHGKKYFVWFSFYYEIDVIYFMELNREKKIVKISWAPHPFEAKISTDTILYGVLLENNVFVIEDLLHYCGFSMKNMTLRERLPLVQELFETYISSPILTKETERLPVKFYLAAMWTSRDFNEEVNAEGQSTEGFDHSFIPSRFQTSGNQKIPYKIHHIQYRSLSEIMPHLNFPIKINIKSNIENKIDNKNGIMYSNNYIHMNAKPYYTKPQYKLKTVFKICADIQFDIYHLFCYGPNKQMVYYDVACIPSYDKSIFMNRLFRKIKENQNLDCIEESDDEDDFQNMSLDKHVDLTKLLCMECVFHAKFKQWIPMRVVDVHSRMVHVSQL